MAAFLNGDSHNNHKGDIFDTKSNEGITTSTVDKILSLTSYSSRLEEVLLALLKEQQILKDKFESDLQGLHSKIDQVSQDAEQDRVKLGQLQNNLDNDVSRLGQQIMDVQDKTQDMINEGFDKQQMELDRLDQTIQDTRDKCHQEQQALGQKLSEELGQVKNDLDESLKHLDEVTNDLG